MALLRIDKFLADNSGMTRREVKRLIHLGSVTVDGSRCTSSDSKIDPDCVTVAVDGTPVEQRHTTYIMLHKPSGVISAVKDDSHQTVIDILPPPYNSMELFPVGRLDLDTEGLLLITDDGKLSHRLISPRSGVKKTYYVQLAQPCGDTYDKQLAAGLVLADGTECQPAQFRRCSGAHECLLTISEGKYHQVKRMFAALGNHVDYLRRTEIGGLALDPSLAPGEMRLLTAEEIALLKAL